MFLEPIQSGYVDVLADFIDIDKNCIASELRKHDYDAQEVLKADQQRRLTEWGDGMNGGYEESIEDIPLSLVELKILTDNFSQRSEHMSAEERLKTLDNLTNAWSKHWDQLKPASVIMEFFNFLESL